MNRRTLLVSMIVVLFTGLTVSWLHGADPTRPPNILLIMTDQQSADSMGSPDSRALLFGPFHWLSRGQ